MQFLLVPEGYSAQVLLAARHNINDAETANVDPRQRSCRLTKESSNSQYKYYSYSVCATECLKKIQLKHCNCFHHNFIVKGRFYLCRYQIIIKNIPFRKTALSRCFSHTITLKPLEKYFLTFVFLIGCGACCNFFVRF